MLVKFIDFHHSKAAIVQFSAFDDLELLVPLNAQTQAEWSKRAVKNKRGKIVNAEWN